MLRHNTLLCDLLISLFSFIQVIDEIKKKKEIDLDLQMEAEDWKQVNN